MRCLLPTLPVGTYASVSECTWTLSALEALRNALYKFKTYLLTYLLHYLHNDRNLLTNALSFMQHSSIALSDSVINGQWQVKYELHYKNANNQRYMGIVEQIFGYCVHYGIFRSMNDSTVWLNGTDTLRYDPLIMKTINVHVWSDFKRTGRLCKPIVRNLCLTYSSVFVRECLCWHHLSFSVRRCTYRQTLSSELTRLLIDRLIVFNRWRSGVRSENFVRMSLCKKARLRERQRGGQLQLSTPVPSVGLRADYQSGTALERHCQHAR